MAVSAGGPSPSHGTSDLTVTTLRERVAQVLAAPEWSPDDGRHLIAGIAELTPEELGQLHPYALADTEAMRRRQDRRIDLVVALRRRLDEARYRPGDVVATLERLALAARYDPLGPAGSVTTAVTVLTRCAAPDTPAVTAAGVKVLAAVRRVLAERGLLPDRVEHDAGPHGTELPWERPLDLATLATMPGGEAAWPEALELSRRAASSRWDASYRAMLGRQRWQELLRLRLAPTLRLEGPVEPVVELALGPDEVPGYHLWLRDLCEEALDHARALRSGHASLTGDRDLSDEDALLVGRAVLQALVWDEAWVGTVVSDLLPLVAALPVPRTRSSSATTLAVALATAVARAPTPETVTALAQTLDGDVRNAGLRKKLRRHLASAQRHLALRPARTLREASDGELAAGDLTALSRSLESGYLAGVTWRLDGWLQHVRAEPRRADLVSRLVWVLTDGAGGRVTIRGHPEPGGIDERWVDADGREVPMPPDATVALWHPLAASDKEREAWREVVWEERIDQPFQQAYREYYEPEPAEPGVLTDLAGAVVDLEPFLDAARAHGWTFERADHRLVRRVGSNWAQIRLTHDTHPSVKEANAVGPVVLSEDRDGTMPWAPGEDRVQRIQVSEVMRTVDLMLAVGVLVPGGAASRLPTIAPSAAGPRRRVWADARALRREVLSRATAELPAVRVGTTHLHVGEHAIDLNSGMITRHGEEVALSVDTSEPWSASWLPYDDGLLARILAAAAQCSGQAD